MRPLTFGEAQFLGDGACDLGGGAVAVEVDLVHAVPVHVGPAQLQTVDGCRAQGGGREGSMEDTEGWGGGVGCRVGRGPLLLVNVIFQPCESNLICPPGQINRDRKAHV